MVFNFKLPKCWKDLLSFEFKRNKQGKLVCECYGKLRAVKTGPSLENDFPLPYYDDGRYVSQTNEGWEATIGLCSGQSNYFGECLIIDPEGEEVYCEVWESYDNQTIVDTNSNQHHINIEFVITPTKEK